jgi:hypothetical protein
MIFKTIIIDDVLAVLTDWLMKSIIVFVFAGKTNLDGTCAHTILGTVVVLSIITTHLTTLSKTQIFIFFFSRRTLLFCKRQESNGDFDSSSPLYSNSSPSIFFATTIKTVNYHSQLPIDSLVD